MMLNATFDNISALSDLLGRKQEYPVKTTNLSLDTNKLLHNIVWSTTRHEQDSNSQL